MDESIQEAMHQLSLERQERQVLAARKLLSGLGGEMEVAILTDELGITELVFERKEKKCS